MFCGIRLVASLPQRGPGQCQFCWTEGHRHRFLSQYLDVPPSASYHPCPILRFISESIGFPLSDISPMLHTQVYLRVLRFFPSHYHSTNAPQSAFIYQQRR